jgi:cytochrome c5
MKKCLTLLCGAIAWAGLSALIAEPAHAVPEFKKAFEATYVGDGKTDAQKKLGETVKTVKCDVCHGKDAAGKPSKKVRNEYGQALGKIVTKKDKKDTAKIEKALKTIESEKSSDGKTFGAKLAAGELPAAK